MRKHLWLGIALSAVLSVLLPAAEASAQWVTVAPPESGFSAELPAPAEFKRPAAKPKVDTRIWIGNNGKLLGLTGVTDYDAHIDAERGTLKSQKRLTFSKAPDGPRPAVDFTFTDAAGPGESLVVVSGGRSYQVVVRAENGYDGRVDMARVIKSFRITQPSRHWQGG
jgi:hypothetical protein